MPKHILTGLLHRRFYLFVSIAFIVVSIFVFAYTYYRYASFYGIDFWQNAISNFLATFLGLVFGIPVALWINEIQQESISKVENQKLQDEAQQRKKRILESLRTELQANLDLFELYPGYDSFTEESFESLCFVVNSPIFVVWKTFSDGGELQWIKDSNLLQEFHWAYYVVQQVKDSGQLFIESEFVHPRGGNKLVAKFLQKHFERNLHDAIRIIKKTLHKLDMQG